MKKKKHKCFNVILNVGMQYIDSVKAEDESQAYDMVVEQMRKALPQEVYYWEVNCSETKQE